MKKNIFEGLPTPAIEYINTLETRIDQLTELLRLSQKARFGSSSEKFKYILEDQISLFNEAEVCADEAAPEPVIVEKHTRNKKRTKEELAKELPVREVVISIPEDERICNICECGLHSIGKEFVRRVLCFVPAQAYIEEILRHQINVAQS